MAEAFETERLIIRRWTGNNLEDFHEYCKNPNVGPNAGWKPHETMEESRKILRSFISSSEEYAIVLKKSGKAIGSLGLKSDHIPHCGFGKGRELGFVLSQNYWGRGLMPEAVLGAIRFAFDKINLDYLSAAHFPFNLRSRRVLEKCGFRYEKTLKDSCTNYKGEKLDEICYIMTREDYFHSVQL
jgi:putative acetyltransferase